MNIGTHEHMDSIIHKIRGHPADSIIAEAAAIIRRGGLVAFPTETVYGLGADALNASAVGQIFAAKGRPPDNPLIIHLFKSTDAARIASDIPDVFSALAQRFWPGPLTLILKKKDCVPAATSGGLDTVALRMPDHPIALSLIEAAGGFIAAPSANLSGRPSPTQARHVIADMDGRVDMILDGGDCAVGLESTILDISDAHPQILRPGTITAENIAAVTGTMPLAIASHMAETAPPRAPGMKYGHYAPRARMTVVQGTDAAVIAYINGRVKAEQERGLSCGIIAAAQSAPHYPAKMVKVLGERRDPAEMAHNLYKLLREFDDEGIDVIYSEAFAANGIGAALMERLHKAAGGRIHNAF